MGTRLGFLCVKGLACLAACLSWVAVQYVLSINYEVRQHGTQARAECRGVSQACFCLVALVAQLMLMSQSLFFLFGPARTRIHRPTLLFPPIKPGILLAPPSQTTVAAAEFKTELSWKNSRASVFQVRGRICALTEALGCPSCWKKTAR